MKERICTDRLYILEKIGEITAEIEEKGKIGSYSSVVENAVSELIKIEMREIAQQQRPPASYSGEQMLSRSIDTVKNNLLRTKRDFDFSEYFKSAEERLRAPATELSDLRMRLRETTGLGRIGQETSVQGLQPYRIKELGLKSAIEGLLAYPLLDVVEIDLDKLRQVYTVEGEWFPFQVKSHDLTFVDDDDASIFTSTEHFSERHVSQAKEILKEIASRARSFPHPPPRDVCGRGHRLAHITAL